MATLEGIKKFSNAPINNISELNLAFNIGYSKVITQNSTTLIGTYKANGKTHKISYKGKFNY